MLPEYQGRGIGSHLLMAAIREAPRSGRSGHGDRPGLPVVAEHGRSVAKHYEPPQWTPEPVEFEARALRPGREVPEPEFDVEIGA